MCSHRALPAAPASYASTAMRKSSIHTPVSSTRRCSEACAGLARLVRCSLQDELGGVYESLGAVLDTAALPAGQV